MNALSVKDTTDMWYCKSLCFLINLVKDQKLKIWFDIHFRVACGGSALFGICGVLSLLKTKVGTRTQAEYNEMSEERTPLLWQDLVFLSFVFIS